MTDDLTKQHWLETYKSLITLSVEGFKFSALANGGAAVALLAYLGNIAGKGATIPDMQYPMVAFLVGLVLCGFAIFFAYLTQFRLLGEIGNSKKAGITHGRLLILAFVFYAFSLVAFGIGSYIAVASFR